MASKSLDRLLYASSVAVVGASESVPNAGLLAMLERGVDVFPVNVRRSTFFGHTAYPSLAAIGRPVDTVLSLLDAERSIEVVAQAAEHGAGSVVVIAAGFEAGGAPQHALRDAAGSAVAVLGPNCNGLINVRLGTVVSGAPALELVAGGVALVTQSGGFFAPFANGCRARGIGVSHMVSTGNEAMIDVADFVDALVADTDTRIIALALETIRRPQAFFAAAVRARSAGKPVVALKLGRSSQARELARTHTGAIVGNSVTQEGVFRQFGLIGARDLSDLLDRVSIFEQLPRAHWTGLTGLAVLSTSGGMAALASDLCERERIALPALGSLETGISRAVAEAAGVEPTQLTVNPVDLTGFMTSRPDLQRSVVEQYLTAPEVDALLFVWLLDEGAGDWVSATVDPVAEAAVGSGKPLVLASVEDGEVAGWALDYQRQGIAIGRGLRGTIRGLGAMGEFIRATPLEGFREQTGPPIPRPAGRSVPTALGRALPFDSTMELLTRIGIPVAPFSLIDSSADPASIAFPFSEPFVVKLAEVPHRTELGVVRLGVDAPDLPNVVRDLRSIASSIGVGGRIVVQPRLAFDSEAFLGVEADTELGQLVVCGIGGTFAELLGETTARLAPFRPDEAWRMITELDAAVIRGFRGARPWDVEQLASMAVALGDLATAAPWLASLDLNPLVYSADGFVAVDALCILRD